MKNDESITTKKGKIINEIDKEFVMEITVDEVLKILGKRKRLSIYDKNGFLLMDILPELLTDCGNNQPYRILNCHVYHVAMGIFSNKLYIYDSPVMSK